MDDDNVIRPHQIRWMPGIREIDTYCQDPSPENLDTLTQFFKTQEGENNLATKLLAVMLPLFVNLELVIPKQILGVQAQQDPRILRIGLFNLCAEITNKWADELIELFSNRLRFQEPLDPAINDDGEIRPRLMRWEPEGPQLDTYLNSPTKETFDLLFSYLTLQQQVFLKLFSVSFLHLVNVQDKILNPGGSQFPLQDVKQSRKAFFVLAAEMSNKWASEYAGLCMNPMLVYEGVRSSLEKVLPTKS
jgi:hypothetical protein